MNLAALPGRAVRELTQYLPGRPARYDLDGKVVLITGGGDGIGLALGAELHALGAKIALLDVRADAAVAAASALPGTLALEADVRDRAAMRCAVGKVVAHFGRLDVVVANAGITPPPATLRTIDASAFDRVIDVNLTGAVNTIHPALDDIITNNGHVVVVASCAAFTPSAGGAAYMASKAATEQLGRALRLELAPYGASATTAYFGVVDTQLARTTLDEDPLGRVLGARLPPPLRQRITAEDAARSVAAGIQRRAATTMAPAAWRIWALCRGMINGAVDRYLAGDHDMRELIRQIEARSR